MGDEVVFVQILTVVMLIIETAEMGLSNSTHDIADGFVLMMSGNTSTSVSADLMDNNTKKVSHGDVLTVRQHYPVYAPSYVLENSAIISHDGSIIREEPQDGVQNLGIPLVCALVSMTLFGIILFIRKFVQSNDSGQTFIDENENFVINGDDIIYNWSESDCEVDDIEEPEIVCRCPDDGAAVPELVQCDERTY